MCRLLEKENISCTVILDSAVGYIMEQVDMVMVGAEGVVESGGIINKVSKKKNIFNIFYLGKMYKKFINSHIFTNSQFG